MALKNLVGTVARTGVSTAVAAVRDPLGTASQAVGLVKHTADAGLDLVRGRQAEEAEHAPVTEETTAEKSAVGKPEKAEKAEPAQAETMEPQKPASEKTEPEDPRDHIPGPDLAAFAPPAPEELPEPIVIEAE